MSRRRLVLALVIMGGAATAWFVRVQPFLNPADALREFEHYAARGDQQLTDPLVLCGQDVVPLVIAGLADRSITRRPWAAAFLGSYPESAPALEVIARDASEQQHTRRYALGSLALIDPQLAARVATEAQHGKTSESDRTFFVPDLSASHGRPYLAALLGWGD